MRRAVLLIAFPCLAAIAPAHAGWSLSGGWAQDRELDTELQSSGFNTGLSVDLGPSLFLSAGYSSSRTQSFVDALDGIEGRLEHRSASAELGVSWPWIDTFGMTFTGGYAGSETRGLDGFRNDTPARFEGPTGSASFWYQPWIDLAFTAGRGYSYIGKMPGWDTSAGASLRLWREWWLDAGYWRGDGIEGWNAGMRLNFGV
jgi:hypothetical protein